MLTQADVVPYLMRRNLVGAESVVDGDLTIINISRRNHNFGVLRERAPCFLLKQGIDRERRDTIANEASVYQLLRASGELQAYLPRYYGYDPQDHVLIVEFLRDARNLQDHNARHGRFSATTAGAMGHALALLHREPVTAGRAGAPIVSHAAPWILSIHRPDLRLLHDVSGAGLQVIKLIQRYREFCDLLDELREEWRTEALIHFDLKWDNCLVLPRRKPGLSLVDWELAGVGDPAWDVGSAFATYLGCWLRSIPVTGETPPERFVQLARYPLETMQPALAAFWRSYVRRAALDRAAADLVLERAVRYTATRLVQAAYEQMQTATQLIGNVVCCLQLSLNILRKPGDALTHLLRISPSSG